MTALPWLTAALFPAPKTLLRLAGGALLACALLLPPVPALAVNDDAVLRRMDSVLEENARLREEAWKARKHGREAAKQADDALNASDERVEKTRTEALAHVAGVSTAQVEGLRREGRSWGQAAGDLGVHPGFLGIGKTPIYEPHSAKRKAPDDEAQPAKNGKRVKKGKDGKAAQDEPAPRKKGGKAEAKKKGGKAEVEGKKAGKPNKPDKSDKPAKSDKAGKAAKSAKSDKSAKAEKSGSKAKDGAKKRKKSAE